MSLSLVTERYGGLRYSIDDAVGLQWSSHYGESGGGFGYLRFTLPREVGHDYPDIDYGYRILLVKYIRTILFDGQIRQIDEISGPDGDAIAITALGWAVVAEDDEILRAFCDKRLAEWATSSEIPKDPFRPDLYSAQSNALGLFLHANNNAEVSVGDYTDLTYEFFPDETAERFKADLSLVLGAGAVFDADIATIGDVTGYVYYTNDSGEGNVQAGMNLHNITQGKSVAITGIDTGGNYITVSSASLVSGWTYGDEIYVSGPLFYAQIDSVVAATVTYSSDVGEGNISNGQTLANITKKSIATIQAHDTVANTITVTDEDHIEGWSQTDVIIVGTSLFYATVQGVANDGDGTGTVTWNAGTAIGQRIVSSDTGWVLYNETRDEYATVDGWTVGSRQIGVDTWADVSAWAASDVIRIYTPFRIGAYDSDGNMVWPASDERQGAIPHDRTAIDVATIGAPTGFEIRAYCLVAGKFNETTFAQLSNVRAYSTTADITAEMLSEYVVGLLSVTGHGWNSDTYDIAAIRKNLEPMVFEFSTPKEALAWACSYGDRYGRRVAWGIRLDDHIRFYLEIQDTSTVDYIVRRSGPAQISMGGDIQESAQYVRGVYVDKMGEQQVTDWQYDEDAYFEERYRRRSIRLENVDSGSEADSLITQYLKEKKYQKQSARYMVNDESVFTVSGMPVPIDELKATGKLIRIEDWRSVEAGRSASDLRNTWTTEQIVGVEIDYDAGTASLIPASAKSTFESYLAELARIKAK